MSSTLLDEALESELATAAESVGCELLRVRFEGKHLQIFLDREDGGVTIEDCQTVSRLVSAILDVHDFGKKKYILEVSSPGLDRELFRPRDYTRFLGSLARVTYFDAERRKTTVIGRLSEFDDSSADTGDQVLTLVEQDSERSLEIPLRDIAKARLEIEL